MKQLVSILLFLSLFSCSNQKSFNSEQWKKVQNRNLMTEDLSDILRSQQFTYNQIIELLGNPDLGKNEQIAYYIKSGIGLEVKLLSITFEKESVKSFNIGYHD